MVKAIEKDQCMLCTRSEIDFFSKYPGTFFCCSELHHCVSCGLIYSVDIPTNEELNQYYSKGFYYDQVADPFHQDILDFSTKLSFARLNLIENETNIFKKKCKVIDIGAGNGSFGTAVKIFSNEATYDVVEPDPEVRQKYGVCVNRQYHDATEIEEQDYDLVVMNQVLEHLPNPLEFIEFICELVRDQGYIYIDVPYKDYLFKPSVEPHLIFWNHKSMSFLIEKVGLKLRFCDTAGMPHEQAKRFFNQSTLLGKIRNPWMYANKINQFFKKISLPPPIDTFRQFHAEQYGGERQWLRCIAQKTV